MEDLQKLFIERHSIRRYTDQPISGDDVKTIVQAALLAPSSKSRRTWQFVIVEDKETLQRLATIKPFGAQSLKGAAFAVVVCANPESTDMWLEDCAIAAEFMQLQAAALGIGSCWVQVRNRDNAEGEPAGNLVHELLDIPFAIEVECIMTFGYSAETRRPVDVDKLKWEQVHIGRWSDREQ